MRRDILAGFSKSEIVSRVYQIASGPGILRTPFAPLSDSPKPAQIFHHRAQARWLQITIPHGCWSLLCQFNL